VAEKTFVSMSCPLRAWRRKAVARFNAQAELVNREEFGENDPAILYGRHGGRKLWSSCVSEFKALGKELKDAIAKL
jgi:hypothetical protein